MDRRRYIESLTGVGMALVSAGCSGDTQSSSMTRTDTRTTTRPRSTDTPTGRETSSESVGSVSEVNAQWTHIYGDSQHRFHIPEYSGPDPPFGKVWGVNADRHERFQPTNLFVGNSLYTNPAGTTGVSVTNGATGKHAWTGPEHHLGQGLYIQDGRYVFTYGATDPETGEVMWKDLPENDSYILNSGIDDAVYGYASTGEFVKRSLAEGSVQWRVNGTSNPTPSSNHFFRPTQAGITVGLRTGHKKPNSVVSLNRSDGAEQWRQPLTKTGFPILAADSGVLVVDKRNLTHIQWLGAETGTPQWEKDVTMQDIPYGPGQNRFAADESTLYAIETTSNSSQLVIAAYRLSDGKQEWTQTLTPTDAGSLTLRRSSGICSTEGRIFSRFTAVRDDNTRVNRTVCLRKTDGREQWRYDDFLYSYVTEHGMFGVFLNPPQYGFLAGST